MHNRECPCTQVEIAEVTQQKHRTSRDGSAECKRRERKKTEPETQKERETNKKKKRETNKTYTSVISFRFLYSPFCWSVTAFRSKAFIRSRHCFTESST